MQTRIQKLHKGSGMKEKDVAYVIKQMLQALNYMHSQPEKIVHRDLKPQNVMLEYAGDDTWEIKITDFGFACIMKPDDVLSL